MVIEVIRIFHDGMRVRVQLNGGDLWRGSIYARVFAKDV